jgi:hypothetical protein
MAAMQVRALFLKRAYVFGSMDAYDVPRERERERDR